MAKKLSSEKIILLVQRDNWQKDNSLNQILIQYLKKSKHRIVWEDPAGNVLYRVRNFENKIKWLPVSIKKIDLKIVQLLYALTHWSYFSFLFNRSKGIIELRSKKLKKSILKLGIENEIIILARSSGGRAASLIADELNIKHIICLGYPFKHPHKQLEPERYIHLKNLKTPFLIIQGIKDEYGGIEVKEKYTLSPHTEILFVNANHNFKISEEDWKKVLLKISDIIGVPKN